jgi:uncharacterized membrane protein
MQRSARRIGTLVALAGASLCAVALEAVRMHHTGTLEHWWLVWNLGLAWILPFFPNAPYILTDFVHLGPAAGVPLWLDAGLISMFAFTGLLLGYASLYLVQVVVREVAGAAAAWAAAFGALSLASVGIYLGRFVRLNSWDVLTDPGFVVGLVRVRLSEPLGNPELIAVTGFFTIFLTLMYLVIYGLAGLGPEREPRRADPWKSRL